jgi:hypothetical protein
MIDPYYQIWICCNVLFFWLFIIYYIIFLSILRTSNLRCKLPTRFGSCQCCVCHSMGRAYFHEEICLHLSWKQKQLIWIRRIWCIYSSNAALRFGLSPPSESSLEPSIEEGLGKGGADRFSILAEDKSPLCSSKRVSWVMGDPLSSPWLFQY